MKGDILGNGKLFFESIDALTLSQHDLYHKVKLYSPPQTDLRTLNKGSEYQCLEPGDQLSFFSDLDVNCYVQFKMSLVSRIRSY